MLNHPTLDRLNELGLFGMPKAFSEIMASGDAATLTVAEGLSACCSTGRPATATTSGWPPD